MVTKIVPDDARTTYTFRTLVSALRRLEPGVTALLRGRHGIGKSAVVYQMAEIWGYDTVIERRISQLSEGDMIGLPDRGAVKVLDVDADGLRTVAQDLMKEYDKEKGGWRVTKFLPTDWFLEAMHRPCLVFLDEINRGTPEVQQACFEFVEKGRLNGRRIHPESRIIAAVNYSREYQVTPMDLAFLDRFWIANVEPDKKDWITWAKSDVGMSDADKEKYGKQNVHPRIIEFVEQCNDEHFEVMPDKQAKMDKALRVPSRRSWHRLSQHLVRKVPGMTTLIDTPNDAAFVPLCRGFVGQDASAALKKFLKQRNIVTPDLVINDFESVREHVKKMPPEEQMALVNKISDYIDAYKVRATEAQARNLKALHETLPAEISIELWTKVSKTNHENAALFHKYIAKYLMKNLSETKVCGVPRIGSGA